MVDTFDVQPKRGDAYKTTNFAKTLGNLFSDGVIPNELNEFAIDNSLGGLNFKVKTGQAIIGGMFVELSALSDSKAMSASSTRQIFVSLTLNASSRVTGAQIEILNGTLPTTPYTQIAELTSDGSSITTVSQTMKTVALPKNMRGEAYDKVIKLSTTIGDYSSPASAVASSEFETPTDFKDEFTVSTNWTASGSGQAYDATGDEWDFTSPNTSGAMYVYRDLTGAEITGDFYMQFKIRIDTMAVSDSCGVEQHFFGLSDITTTQGTNVSQDAIGILFRIGKLILINTNNAAPNATTPVVTGFSAGTWYFRMYRTGNTVFVDVDDSPFFSSPLYSANATIAGTGLRYAHLYSHHTDSGVCSAGTTAYSIDDFVFINGSATSYIKALASYSKDGDLGSYAQTNSEANPNIKYDFTSARDFVAIALALHVSAITISQILIQTSPNGTDWTTIRTINVSDFTNDVYRFILMDRLAADLRHLRVYGVGTGILAVSEIKARYGLTDTVMDRNRYTWKLPALVPVIGADSN